ncbi:MAG: bifunctional (p)ppGpp synthetase/guanosine-3',5'-bis(diphosphate) 3'-pyrophosphohydrolase [Clostridiales bacterium]|nr:bifunctional (p)ppGpp synthetase/guanosine-3',5'-bis(diphosphate) 3'-pyrophosphohydrolase [Clostridiales bacterium]
MNSDAILLHKAIEFAAVKHRNQTRKSTVTPYIVHPIEVMLFLQEIGCSAEVIAAGVLHDTLEDTETTLEELKENFGEKVAMLVASESEDKSKSWQERKQTTIDHLKTASVDTVTVCLADKLSNMQSMVYDYALIGDELWKRFKADKEHVRWYYRGIIESTKRVDCPLRKRLIDCYIELFGDDDIKGCL